MAKTPIARLLHVAWDSVSRIVQHVVADQLDDQRLAGPGHDRRRRDRRGQRYLTTVADHHTGRIVWSAPGRNATTPRRCRSSSTSSASGGTRSPRFDRHELPL